MEKENIFKNVKFLDNFITGWDCTGKTHRAIFLEFINETYGTRNVIYAKCYVETFGVHLYHLDGGIADEQCWEFDIIEKNEEEINYDNDFLDFLGKNYQIYQENLK